MSADGLKPCPFCEGDAELDTMRAYRKISNGDIGNAVAIYCLSCSADMTMCHADHSGLTIEDMVYSLTEAWNRRSPVAEGGGWRTIDSAPKVRGKGLLGWSAEWREPEVIEWDADGKGTHWFIPFLKPMAQPTHWQPLPSPPVPSQEGASEEGQT